MEFRRVLFRSEALKLRDDVAAMDVGGSQRAATSALLAALQGRETILAMAAETAIAKPASEREMISGDAAAAVLVGTGVPIARLVAAPSEIGRASCRESVCKSV